MNWINRLSSVARVSKRVRTVAQSFVSVVAAVLAVLGIRDFAIKYKLTSLERIQQVLFVTDNRIEVQKFLKKMAYDPTSSQEPTINADRAFFAYYEQSPTGEMLITFKSYYQWQKEGQVSIQEQKYSVKPGADTERMRSMEAGRCYEVSVASLQQDDQLGQALKNSQVLYQLVCPVRDVMVDGQKRLGFVGLEFSEIPADKTKAKLAVAEGAVDVASSFD
jgi:hypothetical protein